MFSIKMSRLNDWMAAIMRGVSAVNLALAALAAAILVAATLMVFSEIISRLLFNRSLMWTVEVSGYSLLYMTFLGAPFLLEKNRHVAIDLLAGALPATPQKILTALTNLFGAVICLYFAWYALQVTIDQYQHGIRVTSVLRPQRYIFTAVVPLSMLLLTIQFVAHAVHSLRGASDAE